MCDDHPEFLLDGPLDLLQTGIAVLQHLARVKINKMIVLPELVGPLVLGTVVTELVLDHQVAVEQQHDGVVQGGAAYTVLVVFHLVVKRFDVEMPIGGVDLLKDGKTLWCLAQIVLPKILREYLFDG